MAGGLATNHIWTIYEDADGTFWIGTYDDGLSRFRDGRFFNYKAEHGLFDNGVFQILEDQRGYFWISCNRGIYRVSRQELNDFAVGKISRINSVAYGKQDGMLNIECNGGRLPAGIIARDGKCVGWVGMQDKTRAEAKESLAELKESGVRRIAMVSGDRQAVATRVAAAYFVAASAGVTVRSILASFSLLTSVSTVEPSARIGLGFRISHSLWVFLPNSTGWPFSTRRCASSS